MRSPATWFCRMVGDSRASPGAVELAIAAVAVAVRVDGAMLLPQQLQRHPRPAQLTMGRRPVRLRPTISGGDRRRRVELELQRLVRQAFRKRPAEAGTPRPPDAIPGG